jgi:hypothetical protein
LKDNEEKTALEMVEQTIDQLNKRVGVHDNEAGSHEKTSDILRNYENCAKVLKMTPEQIREEDNEEIAEYDSSRKEFHIKAFESHALGLKSKIQKMISDCEKFKNHDLQEKRENVADDVVSQFGEVLRKHRRKEPKWYNDGEW